MAPDDTFPPAGNPPPVVDEVVEVDADDDEVAESELASVADTRPAWERQNFEPPKAYHGFCHYRDMKGRSVRSAFIQHKKQCQGIDVSPEKAPKNWAVWSVNWGWVTRASLWDQELDRQFRDKVAKDQTEARERHARLAQASLSVMSVPSRAMLEMMRDQETLSKLVEHGKKGPHALMQVLNTVARMAQVIPGLVSVERLALGLTTDSLEIADKRDSDVIANRIVEDPTATELAVALLDRVANPRPSLAIGTGAPSQPGEVDADPALEPVDPSTGGSGAT